MRTQETIAICTVHIQTIFHHKSGTKKSEEVGNTMCFGKSATNSKPIGQNKKRKVEQLQVQHMTSLGQNKYEYDKIYM